MRSAALPACLAVALVALLALPSLASAQGGGFPDQTRFQKVLLNDRPGEPMSLAVLPDGRVLHTARTGEIRVHNPRTGLNTLLINMADTDKNPRGLYQHDEEGLQGIAVDPKFERNHWVYLYYSPQLNTPADVPGTGGNEGDAPETIETQADRDRLAQFAASRTKNYILLSRFKLERGQFKVETEQEILRVPVDRGLCCHVGGQIEFDGQGNLFLSTGDDTNPFQSSGYTPIDDRADRNPAFDARRTAGNTNDLRGKILRIRVKKNGGYGVPAGNLFKRGRARTRPEIHAMGLRNPFRFSVNRTNGDLYLGDYSPDADAPDPDRGPQGTGRWMLIRKPGNYGWPFCASPDLPYVDYDFGTETSGEEFNCDRPVNNSRNNTGRRRLPQVVPPTVWYSYPEADYGIFPELGEQLGGDGIGPMGGPAYQPSKKNKSPLRWPKMFRGHPLFYEWTRDYVKLFELNRPNGGRLAAIHHLFGGPESEAPNIVQDNPMDMEFGPNGALYTLEYGDGFFSENPEAQLSRIDFVRRGEYTPVVKVAADVTAATVPPLAVQFSSAGTEDPDGDAIAYAWDFDADGTVDSRAANPSYTYTERGVYDATLRVTDRTGRSASNSIEITVGNQAPELEIEAWMCPATGPCTPAPDPEVPFQFGGTVHYVVTVTDDQPVACDRVSVSYVLGHDQHGHPQSSTAGCEGDISVPLETGHAGASNLAAVFSASYTDAPGSGETPLTGTAEVILRPPAE
jgi:cytochrome c